MKELIKFSLRRRFFNKTQIFINLILFTACALLLFADHLITCFMPSMLNPINIHTVAMPQSMVQELNETKQSFFYFQPTSRSLSKAKKQYEYVLFYDGEFTLHSEYPLDEMKIVALESLLEQYRQTQILKENKESAALIAYAQPLVLHQKTTAQKQEERAGIVFMVVTGIYFMMLSFATTVANEVVYEKATKTLELILTSVSARTHFLSKLLSGWLTVLLQCAISGGCLLFWTLIRWQIDNGSGLLKAAKSLQILSIKEATFSQVLAHIDLSFDFLLLLLGIAFFLLAGMLLIQMLLVVISSFISSIEAAAAIQAPFYMILIAVYYLTLSLNDPQHMSQGIGYYLSFLPFLSMLMMPCRFLMTVVTVPEFLLAAFLAVASLTAVLHYGGAIYQRGVLDYSNKGFLQIMKAICKRS